MILAVCALVLACSGGAFAAGKLTGPQKKEVGKIAAKVAKKNAGAGPRGPAGPAGPAGAAGAPGPAGPAGTASAYGLVGVNGAGNMSFRINSGFPGEPSNPSPGLTCIPAPKGVPPVLTLEEPGFIWETSPNQCGGGSTYEIFTATPGGEYKDMTFVIAVP